MKTEIVFLDRDTTDTGDLDLSGLESLGDVRYFGTTGPAEMIERVADAGILLSNKAHIGRETIEAAASLELIQVVATGVNNVDLDAAREKGIAVCNVSGYSTPAVAQHTFALLLNLFTQVHRYDRTREEWPKSPFFTRLDFPVRELKGKVLGIAGYGEIGQSVAAIGRAFGMEIVALGREGAGSSGDVTRLPGKEFFETCDAISLHCPLTADTHHMIHSETLAWMKPDAVLINTGRGDLVNEQDLLAALENGVIGGAGLDVLSEEPPPEDHPLILSELPNLIVTPHSGWSSVESRQRLIDEVVENLQAFFRGEERNRVV